MTTTILPRLPVTKKLREILEVGLGKPVGLGAVPRILDAGHPDRSDQAKAPYGILYPLWTNTSGPAYGAPDADSEFIYQLTIVGERVDQLDVFYDKARLTLFGRGPSGFLTPISIPGMHVMDRAPKDDGGSEPGASGSLIETVIRFGISVTPSDT